MASWHFWNLAEEFWSLSILETQQSLRCLAQNTRISVSRQRTWVKRFGVANTVRSYPDNDNPDKYTPHDKVNLRIFEATWEFRQSQNPQVDQVDQVDKKSTLLQLL